MKRKSLLREMIVGLLLGLLIMPAQPAQAQWTVFDPSQYALQIKKRLEEANRWVETARHYQQLYQNAVQQYTTLRGVLQTVDRTLAKNMELARLTNDIGEVIRGADQLKRQVENMVRYQIDSLQRIDDRLSNGVFDPDKDIADFEEYLLYSMGRNSRQTIQLAVRTALADAQVNKWVTEKQKLSLELSKATKIEKQLLASLEKEKGNPDPRALWPLTDALQTIQQRIASLKKDIAELDEKIQPRINAFGLKLSDMENFGYSIHATTQAWWELQTTKDELAKTFDQMILGTQPTP
jgi:predicted  nucleic acid-binding Zn-ribbon protein